MHKVRVRSIGRLKYRVRVELDADPQTGKRHEIDRIFSGTKSDAETYGEELARKAGVVVREGKAPTVKAFLEDRFIPWAYANLSQTTAVDYESKCKSRIIPRFGKLSIDRLTQGMIESWTTDMAGEGLGDQTRLNYYRVLRRAVHYAVAIRAIADDPTDGTTVPKVEERDVEYLDEAGLNAYLDAFESYGDVELYKAVVLGVSLGLRRSEVLGLDWQKDMHMQPPPSDGSERTIGNDWLKIRETSHQAGKVRWRKGPKSQKSRRALLIAPWAADALWPLRGIGPVVHLDPEAFERRYRKAVADMKLPHVPFEELRNSHGSVMVDKGMTPRAVADQFGHGSDSVTQRRYIRVHQVTQVAYAQQVQTLRRRPEVPAKSPQSEATGSDGR